MYVKRLMLFWGIVITLCCVVGCAPQKRSTHLQRQASLLLNHEVNIDLNLMEFLRFNGDDADTTSLQSYRFVVYSDANNCVSCELAHIGRWNRYVNFHDGNLVDFIFIFHPAADQVADLRQYFNGCSWRYRMYLDSLGVFERDNELLVKKFKARAFLLDGDNRIVFVGDPTKDLDTQEAYLHVVDSLAQNRETDKNIQSK